ncbi:MAG: carbohydrate kinase family protein, partial [bacterium]
MKALNIDINKCLYKCMIGVGGIGSGKFFLLEGNHTLGREESRSGRFLDTRDYCKLHIISHYVKTLLGHNFDVIPVGKIGDDEVGKSLLKEMSETGMNLNYLKHAKDSPTLFSFCFVYPDGSGGNMTTNDSACAKVDAAFVEEAEPEFIRSAGRGIALAAPEVPMEAREKLLELGTEYNFFRVASFTSEEMISVLQSGILRKTDLLAINIDEAAAI